MSLESIAQENPHLKEIVELYRKVQRLEQVELSHDYGGVSEDLRCYTEADVERVLGSFSSIFGVGGEDIESLRGALLSGSVDFMELPRLCAEGKELSEESNSLLYMISRPYFMSLSRGIDVDNIKWEEGRCPLCNAVPSLSVIERNVPRKYHCSFCRTTGHYRRIGCPYCKSNNSKDIDLMVTDELPGMRIEACRKCKTYLKSFEAEKLVGNDIMELDIISLPLDIVARQKGFSRRSPNPVGMTRFV